jgi:hypothetical protein
MVQGGGTTHRVVRVEAGLTEVIRLLDVVRVGSFRSSPALEVTPSGIERAELVMIARAAVQGAKTSWVGRLLRV